MNPVTQQWGSVWCHECWDCSREIIWFCWCWHDWTDWHNLLVLNFVHHWFSLKPGIAECRTQRYPQWLRVTVSKGSTRSGAFLAWRLQQSWLSKRCGSLKNYTVDEVCNTKIMSLSHIRSSERYGVEWLDALKMSFRHWQQRHVGMFCTGWHAVGKGISSLTHHDVKTVV